MNPFTDLLVRSRLADQGFYLLVDPLADCPDDHPLRPKALVAKLGPDAIQPILRADLARDAADCPQLITLAQAGQTLDEALLGLSVDQAMREPISGKRLVCGWLTSPSSPAALADHLAQRCLVVHADSQRVAPFFEPLRVELLAVSLRERMAAWLWPISQWIVPSSSGRLLHLAGHADETPPSLGPAELSAQVLAPMVGKVLVAWQRLADQPMRADEHALAPLLRQEPGPDTHAAAKVLTHLQRGHAQGLRNPSDRMIHALQHLRVHRHLDAHPRIQQCIQEAAAGKTSLLQSLAALDRAQWHDVLGTLNSLRS